MPSRSLTTFFEQDMKVGAVFDFGVHQVGVFSRKDPHKPGPNEDAALIATLGGGLTLLAVADGVGGSRAGEVSSRAAIDKLVQSVAIDDCTPDTVREAVLRGFEEANEKVTASGTGGATTLSTVVVERKTVRFFHVGDSVILLMGGKGRIRYQSTMHSPVGYAVESGFLDEEEAMHHGERHVVSNVVGSPDMSIELGPTIEMAPRDTLLLASDGLFDNLLVEEVVSKARKGPLTTVLRELAEGACARMDGRGGEGPSKPDDLTFVLLRLGAGRQPERAIE